MVRPTLARGDGDGWKHCADGQRRWGRFGAAGLMLRAPDPTGHPLVLMQHRAHWTHFGGMWGLPGGARNSGESAAQAAVREAHEETGIDAEQVLVRGEHADFPGGDDWSYTTVFADAERPLDLEANMESAELRWIPEPEVSGLTLHPGFASTWPRLHTTIGTLVVDAANVVGSTPDGWWRDRAGANQRLLNRLTGFGPRTVQLPNGALRWVRECVVVLEGEGRDVTDVAGVDSVRADGDADSAIVELTTSIADAVVVTADRGLRRRLRDHVHAVGPATLREWLQGAFRRSH